MRIAYSLNGVKVKKVVWNVDLEPFTSKGHNMAPVKYDFIELLAEN